MTNQTRKQKSLWQSAVSCLSRLTNWWSEFRRTVRRPLVVGGLTSAAGTISFFVAMFLPLKALLIAASPVLPGYMNDIGFGWSRNEWVIVLTGLSMLLFVLAVVGRLVAGKFVGRAGNVLLEQVAHEGNLSPVERRAIRRICTVISEIVSHVVVIIISSLGLIFLSWETLGATLAVVLLEISLTSLILQAHGGRLGAYVGARVKRNPNIYFQLLTAGNFFVAFAVILFDVMVLGTLGIIGALLTMLLIRRWLQAAQGLAQGTIRVYSVDRRVEGLLMA